MSEKKMWELQIDEVFRDLIPPLQEDEQAMLEESIVTNGCESPLIVWNGIIVDGHNRYAICRKHGIPFEIQERNFESRDAVMLWMVRNQLGRRNLNTFQRTELVLKFEPMLKAEARGRLATSTGGADPRPVQTSSQAEQKGRTRETLAEMAGVSHDTVKKVKKLVEDADAETKRKLRQGDVTINKAYRQIMDSEHAEETKICDRCHLDKPYKEFSIPSNRSGYSCLCKTCEKEIDQAARDAAEVASKTIDPVETRPVENKPVDSQPAEMYPLRGMAMHDGAPIHTGCAFPDTPDMFPRIIDLVQSAARSYLLNLQMAMKRYSEGMTVNGGNAQLMEIVTHTHEQAEAILSERMKGEWKHEQ